MHHFLKIEDIFKEPLMIHNTSLQISAGMGVIIVKPAYKDIGEIIRVQTWRCIKTSNTGEVKECYNPELDE